ncbi:YpzG family protein [Sporolactobacillus sp. Y61]|uniref:YpzG family protein n=1 Tax=Sporolactobacillus sp. Y61 TaxID=3160863 RepID=A0AAU8II58_9BACL|nr:YpzG family protein [Sporolactobacillus sp. THM19-2]
MKKEPVINGNTNDLFQKSHATHSSVQVNGETEMTQAGKILKVSARRRQK